jgi:hypothetical protein
MELLKRASFALLDILKDGLLFVLKKVLQFFFMVLCLILGFILLIAMILGVAGIGAGIIWLTWDHMNAFWSIILALLGVGAALQFMPKWMWLTAEQEAFAETVADKIREKGD